MKYRVILAMVVLIMLSGTTSAVSVDVSVYNNGWQLVLVDSTKSMSSLDTQFGPTWIAAWDSTNPWFEVYKPGWSFRSAQSNTGGDAVLMKFSSNKAVTVNVGSYNWVLQPGDNLVGCC